MFRILVFLCCWLNTSNLIQENAEVGLLPVVVFSFSKKKCDEIADFMGGQNFLTAKVGKIFIHSNTLDFPFTGFELWNLKLYLWLKFMLMC